MVYMQLWTSKPAETVHGETDAGQELLRWTTQPYIMHIESKKAELVKHLINHLACFPRST